MRSKKIFKVLALTFLTIGAVYSQTDYGTETQYSPKA